MILHPKLRYRDVRTFTNEVKTLSEVVRLERLPLRAIRERQTRLLRWIVAYAHRKVPFYRDSFARSGIHPGDIRSIDDLDKIPILTKEQILSNYPHRIVAEGCSPRTAFRCTSSGTSGVPTTYLSDWATRDANFALLYRARSLFGYRPKHLECVFTYLQSATRWYQRLGFHRRIKMNLLQSPEKSIEQLIRLRPDVLYTLPSYLRMLCLEGSEELARLSMLLVVSSGEVLDPKTREMLAAGFKAPVLDLYGAAEQPYISSECRLHSGQHVNMFNTLVEVARNGERTTPGEIGDILVTTLTNRAMPLIRYRIGDACRILPGECGCGRHGEMLDHIQGRRDDFLKSRSGREVPAIVAEAVVLSSPQVKAFRVIQKSPARLKIQLVGQVEEEARVTIAESMRRAMSDPGLGVEFEDVEKIEPDPSGKRRVVICET
jgi:phenylacetate-CoA ligase